MLFPESRRALAYAEGEIPAYAEGFDIAASRDQARTEVADEPREEVAEVADLDADGVPVRLYRPADNPDGAVIVHLHGGGFVFHDIEVHDPACRRLANRAGMAVLSVDYRRSPEHRFPAAPDDVSTVLTWLEREADGLGIAGPAYAHGDSAGGNLALVAALRHPGRFAATGLIYPFLDPTASFDSYRTAADGFDPREAAWYWEQYAASADDLTNPDLAPLLSTKLSTLPPTLVVTAEHDPLRDEGEHLAGLLADAGVEVVATRYLGQLHGFWRQHTVFPSAEPLMRQVATFFNQHRPG
ncbi:MAG: alpha/beta hydrolase [Nocardioidaceae bacterium]